MTTREEAVSFGLSFPGSYRDEPFHDANWTVIRRHGSRRIFLCIYERHGQIWLNVKCDPEWGQVWRNAYEAIRPAYHMNKEHWISIILNGTVPDSEIKRLIIESYELVDSGGK